MSIEQQYIDLFVQHKAEICRQSAPAMNELRDKAFDDFQKLGFPTNKLERYRRTNIAEYFEPNYGMSLSSLTEVVKSRTRMKIAYWFRHPKSQLMT